MIKRNEKTRRPKISLRLTFFILLMTAAIAAVSVLFLVNVLGNSYINNQYMSEEERQQREEQYVSDLQAYVSDNELSSKDTAKISKWVRENKYLYVMLFTLDDELILDSGMAGKEEDKAPDEGEDAPVPDEELPGGDDGNDGESEPEDDYKPGGLLNDLTKEQLVEIARQNDSHPITLSDTTILASMADFSEYLYYDIVNIASLAIAVILFVSVVMVFFFHVTKRISRLSEDVTLVADGDMNHEIKPSWGMDEISQLSSNVENMRSAIIENLENERAARNANSELITAMSHDIRTPLTVLLGYIDMMKLHSTDEVMSDYIKATEKTALRLKTLSDDMFNYFLMFGGNAPELNIDKYNAGTLLEQILMEYVILLRERGYEVNVELLDEEIISKLYISTDVSGLMRIVENLFSNVIKHGDRGGPVTISVSATDVGIACKLSNYVSKEPSAESSGIGLKTCAKLSELLGIRFESREVEDVFHIDMLLPATSDGNEEGER